MIRQLQDLVRLIFYGNIFYGLCAVAMCIETNVVMGLGLNHFPFYLLIFFGSWIYYTMIYVRSTSANANKEINAWYRQNLNRIKNVLSAVLLVEVLLACYFVSFHFNAIKQLSLLHWLLLASVPAGGALYTFHMPAPFKKFRQIGWLKPIVIGATWTGWVTIFPVVAWQVQYGIPGEHIYPQPLFWLINLIFITALAIIFDVKDYKTDIQKDLMTYPAQYGIKNTYRYILLPLTVFSIILVVLFQINNGFTFAQSIIQQLPFLLLLYIINKRPGSLNTLYYLFYIDGLMLLKALCNIVSIEFFK
ncbi:UbiA family prenyltransferase [Aridibaculum aurantiacum]|uniref:UbiA family prenyltransferase n=1 Tax=Aridibaculum aurantiacum TaxID=2810307 RepID=UPI001A95F4EB|nr:UbiA family prenyltransferase [Aridibaculum aurantiacum]